MIYKQASEPVILARRHRTYQHRYDCIADKHRRGIEGFFARLKQLRRIFSRYNNLTANVDFIKLASTILWLKQLKVTTASSF